jgi:3-dehydroquinate dehydratase / shikimate dehydrogenase
MRRFSSQQSTICIPIVGPHVDNIIHQLREASKQADVIELCLDLWEGFPWTSDRRAQIKLCLQQVSQPIVLACRSQKMLNKELLQEIVPKVFYLDAEEFTPLSSQPPWVRSRHFHEAMPSNLQSVLDAMIDARVSAYKIAARARSSLDALAMLHCMKKHRESFIGVAMGEEGRNTRILSPVFGGGWTYACLDQRSASAPGQINVQELLDVYHYRTLNPETKMLGVIGDPVSQSMGRFVHNAVFRELGVNAVYLPWRVRVEEVQPFIAGVRSLNLGGLSVTMPLKEAVIPLLDTVDPAAKAMGAVNTIVNRGGTLVGYNTDGPGALDAIESKRSVRGKRIIIVGAGGSSRAVAYEALQRGASVIILNRTAERGKALAHDLGCEGGGLELLPQEARRGYDILIQCTSVGMAPDIDKSPVAEEWLLPTALIVDAIYKPEQTRLLKEAQAKGCSVVTGREFYMNQAIRQWFLWLPTLGYTKPLDLVALKQLMKETIDVVVPRYSS